MYKMDCAFCFFIYYILPSNNLHISKSLIFYGPLITTSALWNKGFAFLIVMQSWVITSVTHIGDAAQVLNVTLQSSL